MHLILKDCSETVFFLWKMYLWLKFQQTGVIFAGERPQKPPKRGYFMDAASPWKHLKIYNLTTTNATLMKPNVIMCLYKTFNLAVNQKPLKMSQKATRNCHEIKRILTFSYHLKLTQIMRKRRGFFIAIHYHLTLALT